MLLKASPFPLVNDCSLAVYFTLQLATAVDFLHKFKEPRSQDVGNDLERRLGVS